MNIIIDTFNTPLLELTVMQVMLIFALGLTVIIIIGFVVGVFEQSGEKE